MRFAPALIAALAFGVPAHGEDLDRARECARMTEPLKRLGCYDAVFSAAAPAAASEPAQGAGGAASTVEPPPFGENQRLRSRHAPKVSLPKSINATVQKVDPLPKGLFGLSLDNGQVWVTRESDWALEFKAGDRVSIARMLAGAYRISHAGAGRNVSVQRVL